MTRTKSTFMALIAVLVLPMAAIADLITNGSFETGDFTGWTVTDTGSGTFAVDNGTAPPNGAFTTPGASDGSFYAVSYQPGPGTHALTQAFTVGVGTTSLTLAFDMFVQTNASLAINAAGLDHTANPNQHARVDLLAFGSGAFDTGAGVIANFYLGIDGRPTQPYTSYLFDIFGFVTPGQSYILRFAQTDNQGNFNLGVDNVSVTVPEPGTLALLGIGLFGMGLARRRKKV